MFVTPGARKSLTHNEQHCFISEEVPALAERVKILGLDMNSVTDRLLNMGGEI